MAVVTATLVDCKVLDGSYDSGSTNSTRRIKAVLFVSNGATAVTGGTDTLDVVVSTLLAQSMRNSKTYTLRDWAVYQPAIGASAAYAATGTVSGSTISLTPKTPADWSTNATIAASGMTVAPYGIFVIADES